MSNTTVHVNNVECSGCMGCVDMFPEVFDWDETTETVIVKTEEADPETVREAMALCPQDCIETD